MGGLKRNVMNEKPTNNFIDFYDHVDHEKALCKSN